ncbi:hypothetical protein F5884DRAFT_854434 [Xylogone sp. PMI_703]|nr:hypothetical protein F5884DRAFT_854434 [Xylogone sp. PMI_703]
MLRSVGFLFGIAGVVSAQYAALNATNLSTITITSTVYNGIPATSYVFLPGNSPTPSASLDNVDLLPNKEVLSTILSTVFITTTPPATTTTIYPCADPLPSPGPAYGLHSTPADLHLVNDLHQGTQGQNATACCHTCFFEIENCIQAWFYNVEGCVVSQASNLTSASGEGVTSSCPAGTFRGLTYGPDNATQIFGSTGDIAGPCGQSYTNL